MKIKLLLFSFLLMNFIYPANYAIRNVKTPSGCGRIFACSESDCVCHPTVEICNISFALNALVRKSSILGQKLYIVVWTIDGRILEGATCDFDKSDLCFQQIRSRLLGNPNWFDGAFFNLVSNSNCVARAIFIGPMTTGAVDPINQLHTLVNADRPYPCH